ncbi:MAG: HAD family hydrolase [Eubacteriales bacterium]
MKAVIFDMDGLLIDSETRSFEAWLENEKIFGIYDVDKFFPMVLGTCPETRKEIFDKFYDGKFDFYACEKQAQASYRKKEENRPFPLKKGAKELLQYLKENGYATGIASSGLRDTIIRRFSFHGMLEYFDTIVSGEMVKISKPAPDIFLLCAERLGISAKDCTVLEDSANGIKAALAANMRPVLVPDIFPPAKETVEIAHAVYPSLLDVRDAFASGKL